jgi:Protein of unknown function (DUF3887)
MKTKLLILFLTVASYVVAQTPNPLHVKSSAVLNCMVNGNFAEIAKYFDSTMQQQLPADKLKDVWKTLNQQAGIYIKSTTTKDTTYQVYNIVLTKLIFQNVKLVMKTVFDKNGKITGLFFVPDND